MKTSLRPLPISIIIATYRRRDDLRETLTQLRECEPVSEIIVIDNASADGTVEMIRDRFPEIHLVELSKNIGVPAFGIGVAKAKSPYVFLLDDDAVPEPMTLNLAVTTLNKEPLVGVIACHIVEKNGQSVTDGWPHHPLLFWGCGACIRRSAIIELPYLFDPRLILHGTEIDLAIRLYAKGIFVQYMPEVVVRHRFSIKERSDARRIYYLTQSALFFALKHLPMRYALLGCTRHLLFLFTRAVQTECIGAFISGLLAACRQISNVLSERKPVSDKIAYIYYTQVWEYEPMIHRFSRMLIGYPASRRSKPLVGFHTL